MNITLEMVDTVRERTGASYEKAKNALIAADGDVVDAIITIENENERGALRDLTDKIKEAVKAGNVTKIRVSKGEEELLSLPVTAGAAVGVLGLATAPWAVIAVALAGVVGKYGFDCKFELIKDDGTVDVL